MSRSIHTTRKTISKLSRMKPASDAAKAEVIAKARSKLARKRRIKRLVNDERKRPTPPAETNPQVIPIETHHASHHIHHSASAEDLRAVLSLLPPPAIAGISSIKLILGKEYLDERRSEDDGDPDPFTGRISHQLLPGVYAGACFGTYHPSSGRVTLHAHVYDADKLPFDQRACELYLRFHALKTFVHEVAHHHDQTHRIRRGRWLADRKENSEWYAEKMEHEWTKDVVLPYLEKAYASDVRGLLDFIEHQGGWRPDFKFFLGDPRTTRRDGLIRISADTATAFESWVEDFPKYANLAESRLAFAWALHYSDEYEICLQILDRLLVENPVFKAALTCKADTLIHLDREDEAFAIADQLLADDAENTDAWEIRGDALQCRRDWKGLLDNCDNWLAVVPENSKHRLPALRQRAIAYCALGDTGKTD